MIFYAYTYVPSNKWYFMPGNGNRKSITKNIEHIKIRVWKKDWFFPTIFFWFEGGGCFRKKSKEELDYF